MSGRSVNLTTLFLGRLRPPERLTSTSCAYFRQQLTTAPLESAEGETKVCGQTGYRTQDLCLTSQVPYRLRYAARRPTNNEVIRRRVLGLQQSHPNDRKSGGSVLLSLEWYFACYPLHYRHFSESLVLKSYYAWLTSEEIISGHLLTVNSRPNKHTALLITQ